MLPNHPPLRVADQLPHNRFLVVRRHSVVDGNWCRSGRSVLGLPDAALRAFLASFCSSSDWFFHKDCFFQKDVGIKAPVNVVDSNCALLCRTSLMHIKESMSMMPKRT